MYQFNILKSNRIKFAGKALVIISLIMISCKDKEPGTDLAKPLVGNWEVFDVTVNYISPDTSYQYRYNPQDSAHVGRVSVKKIDRLHVNVHMQLSRKNGKLLYEYTFETPLIRDTNDDLILFDTKPGGGTGGYDATAKILTAQSVALTKGELNGAAVWLLAKR